MKYFNATIQVSGKPTRFSELSDGDLFVVNPTYGFGEIRIWPTVYVKVSETGAEALEGCGYRSMTADDEVWYASFRGITGEIK